MSAHRLCMTAFALVAALALSGCFVRSRGYRGRAQPVYVTQPRTTTVYVAPGPGYGHGHGHGHGHGRYR